MKEQEALRLCDRWLPLWTGNRPDALIEVYAENVFYRDPAKPDGIHERSALLAYFRKLLAAFPDWLWRADAVFPVEGGFTLRRKAEKVYELPGIRGMVTKEGQYPPGFL